MMEMINFMFECNAWYYGAWNLLERGLEMKLKMEWWYAN